MNIVTRRLTLTPKWNTCSINIIWAALGDAHHLFVWRVRISLSIHGHLNFCPVDIHKPNQRCTELIEVTAKALSDDVVALMLKAVQRDNLELSVKQAVER